jgi:hypothetical protein
LAASNLSRHGFNELTYGDVGCKRIEVTGEASFASTEEATPASSPAIGPMKKTASIASCLIWRVAYRSNRDGYDDAAIVPVGQSRPLKLLTTFRYLRMSVSGHSRHDHALVTSGLLL